MLLGLSTEFLICKILLLDFVHRLSYKKIVKLRSKAGLCFLLQVKILEGGRKLPSLFLTDFWLFMSAMKHLTLTCETVCVYLLLRFVVLFSFIHMIPLFPFSLTFYYRTTKWGRSIIRTFSTSIVLWLGFHIHKDHVSWFFSVSSNDYKNRLCCFPFMLFINSHFSYDSSFDAL